MAPRRSKRAPKRSAAEAEAELDADLDALDAADEPVGPDEDDSPPLKRARRGSVGASNGKAPKRSSPRAKPKRTSNKQETSSGGESDSAETAPAKKAPAKKKPAARGKGARAKKRTPLFDIVSATKSQPSALAVAVDEWIRAFEQDEINAILELVNFLIKASGCTDREITRKQYESMDAEAALQSVTTVKFMKTGEGLDPLSKPGAPGRAFRSHFNDLWSKIVTKVPARIFDQEVLFTHIFDWLHAFAHSKARGFRHTGTAAALQMVTALCKVATRVEKETDSVQRQLANEKRHAPKGPRARALQTSLKTLQARLSAIHSHMKDGLVTPIFKHRYRDIAVEIRVLCVESLGAWATAYRHMFLDNDYTKYLYWALHDYEVSVRAAALAVLGPLLQDAVDEAREAEFSDTKGRKRSPSSSQSSQSSQITQADDIVTRKLDGTPSFLLRVKPRIVEMTRDQDAAVRQTAIRACTDLAILQKLDRDDLPGLYELMTADSPDIRAEAAHFTVSFLFNTIVPANSSSGNEAHTALRTLLELIESSSLTPEFPDYAIDALWDGLPALQDWAAMTDLLVADVDQSSADPSQVELEQEQQVLLARVISACVRRACGESIVPGGNTAAPDSVAASCDAITKHFARLLPTLVERFAGDADVLTELLALPQCFSLSHLAAQRQRPVLKSLLSGLSAAFTKFGDETFLATIAATLRVLESGVEGAAAEVVSTSLSKLLEETATGVTKACSGLDQHSKSPKGRGRKKGATSNSTAQILAVWVQRLFALSQNVHFAKLWSGDFAALLSETMSAVRGSEGDNYLIQCRFMILKCSLNHCAHSLAGGDSSAALTLHSEWLFSELEDALEDSSDLSDLSGETGGIPDACRFASLGDEAFQTCANALVLFSSQGPDAAVHHRGGASMFESLVGRFESRCSQVEELSTEYSDNAEVVEMCTQTATGFVQPMCQAVLCGIIPRSYAGRLVSRYLDHGKEFEDVVKEFLRQMREDSDRDFWKVVVSALELTFERWVEDEETESLKRFQKLSTRLAQTFGVGHTTAKLGPVLFDVLSEGVLAAVAAVAEHTAQRSTRWAFLSDGIARFVPKIPVQANGVGAKKMLSYCESQPEQAGIDLLGSDAAGLNRDDARWYSFLAALEKVAVDQGATLDDSSKYADIVKALKAPPPKKGSGGPSKAAKPKRAARSRRSIDAESDGDGDEDGDDGAQEESEAPTRRSSRSRRSLKRAAEDEASAEDSEDERPSRRSKRAR
jgi:STAG domain/Stromalin conservative domain